MDIQGILGIDSDVRNGYDDIKVTFNIDADASKKDIEAHRRAVAEALGGVRHRHQPDQRHRRSRLAARPYRGQSHAELTAIESHARPVVIGAGHAGLAASRCLSERSIDHVVLERGEVANSWRRERWDSLRLLTPNWQSRLPGYRYEGAGPRRLHDDGRGRRVRLALCRRRRRAGAHAHHGHVGHGGPTRATTSPPTTGELRCRCAGAGERRLQPPQRAGASAGRAGTQSQCFTALDYRNPGQLPEGGVLVVGASATGVQLADEIHRSGRPVTLSVGEHVRLPRTLSRPRRACGGWTPPASGTSATTKSTTSHAREELPSPQLVGTPERTTLDLNALSAAGVEIVGRLARPSAMAARFFPAGFATSSRWPI